MRFIHAVAVLLLSLFSGSILAGSTSINSTSTNSISEAAIDTVKHHSHQTKTFRPIVIAHRGASGYRPEHTLAAYRLAIWMGADFIEPDLVPTRDGVLITRHENELSGSTNVADRPEFANRKTTKDIDGVPTTGWFSEDFTLAEIKTLRARERIPEVRPRNTRFDDRYTIPTLAEVIELVERESKRHGRRIGIYPETKHPTHFAKSGKFIDGTPIAISTSQKLIMELKKNNFTDPSRVFIQSFEIENLLRIKNIFMPEAGINLPLVQLLGDIDNAFLPPASNFSQPYDVVYNASVGADMQKIYGDLNNLVDGGLTVNIGYDALVSAQVFGWMKQQYASGIGPWKNSFLLRKPLVPAIDANGDGKAQLSNKLNAIVHPFLSDAIETGLLVHPYTLRAEEQFLSQHANGVNQSVIGEATQMLSLGVHGYFIDQPDLGVYARDLFIQINRPVD